MRLVFSRRAEFDLEEIGDYIARDNPRRAVSFVNEIRGHSRHLLMFPFASRLFVSASFAAISFFMWSTAKRSKSDASSTLPATFATGAEPDGRLFIGALATRAPINFS